jgi:formate-dependent phosphoribosylglycinamide formyltransferase (GAR transformylase)
MNAIRNAIRSVAPSGIHRHQDTAQHEINHAAVVVEQQKKETDLLAKQVWEAMGGHP